MRWSACDPGWIGNAGALVQILLYISSKHPPQGRLLELEELQKLLSSTNEELSDLQFQMTEDRVAAAAREQDLGQRLAGAREQLAVSCPLARLTRGV